MGIRSGRILLWIIAGCLLSVLCGCVEKHPLHPSYDELKQRGFYVYVLPEGELNKYKWSQTISIWSWDRHCKGLDWTENFNPLRVEYVNTDKFLFILIGPWNMYWDASEEVARAQIDTKWSKDGYVAYYMLSDRTTHMRFEDIFGIPVQIVSNLAITEIIPLINQLEYVGPPQEEVTNPWDSAKCRR